MLEISLFTASRPTYTFTIPSMKIFTTLASQSWITYTTTSRIVVPRHSHFLALTGRHALTLTSFSVIECHPQIAAMITTHFWLDYRVYEWGWSDYFVVKDLNFDNIASTLQLSLFYGNFMDFVGVGLSPNINVHVVDRNKTEPCCCILESNNILRAVSVKLYCVLSDIFWRMEDKFSRWMSPLAIASEDGFD